MLVGIAKVLGGIILTGIGVVAAAMGAGVTGDGIAETLNGGPPARPKAPRLSVRRAEDKRRAGDQ